MISYKQDKRLGWNLKGSPLKYMECSHHGRVVCGSVFKPAVPTCKGFITAELVDILSKGQGDKRRSLDPHLNIWSFLSASCMQL